PAINAVSTTPTCRWLNPRAASSAPSKTAVNPYPAARTPCPATSSLASPVSPGRRDLTRSPPSPPARHLPNLHSIILRPRSRECNHGDTPFHSADNAVREAGGDAGEPG